ncbi:NAD-dependent histone deacetylase SIR2 [Rhizoctonia solani]|uniref:NAD-dependent histone deacetylase SIR2 n=1 Tax=Rhizoctonia solani TaxID=456999 RepID=A0A8H8P8H3_9AGAM|nr:NAD-dependent histone deacetylase SIR2 [Rhizoctonia solani]QRW27496.1 NAD-dependent histone deacetylase SIR2 [Rhizoctonia solani]
MVAKLSLILDNTTSKAWLGRGLLKTRVNTYYVSLGDKQRPKLLIIFAAKSLNTIELESVELTVYSIVMAPSNNVNSFRKALQQSKNLILVAGAGLSAASGRNTHIPGFRLLDPNYRGAVAPLAINCTLITQNVDGLSLRAQDALGSESLDNVGTSNLNQGQIIEMHGRLLETLCTKCKHRNLDTRSPICPALAGTELRTEAVMDDAGKRVPEAEISPNDLPRCGKDGCGGLLRPGVVWFGESIPRLNAIESLVEEADMCLVVGTSSVVYPAAGFADVVQDNGGKVAVFNIEASQGDQNADFLFLGPCEKTLGEALGIEVPIIREA